MKAIKNIKLNNIGKNPMIRHMVLLFWISKGNKTELREHKMNSTAKSVLGTLPAMPAVNTVPRSSSKTLANLLLAAGVAALVVGVDQMIDSWAESHVVAAWLVLGEAMGWHHLMGAALILPGIYLASRPSS